MITTGLKKSSLTGIHYTSYDNTRTLSLTPAQKSPRMIHCRRCYFPQISPASQEYFKNERGVVFVSSSAYNFTWAKSNPCLIPLAPSTYFSEECIGQ